MAANFFRSESSLAIDMIILGHTGTAIAKEGYSPEWLILEQNAVQGK